MPSIARLNLVKLLSAFLILSVTSGCAIGLTDPVPLNSYCAITKPISYDSTGDTPQTIAQVEEHNSRWACICENDCPQPTQASNASS